MGKLKPLGGVESDESKPGGVLFFVLLPFAVEGKLIEKILHAAAFFGLVGGQGVEDFLRARFAVERFLGRLAGVFEVLEIAGLGEVSIDDGVGVRAWREKVDARGGEVLRELANRRSGLA